MNKFGSVLRDLREKAHVSLGSLARHLGVSVPYLSDVERGNRPPLVQEKIFQAATFLNVDVGVLLASAADAKGNFQLATANLSGPAREVGAMLARQWPVISDNKLQRMKLLLLEPEDATAP
jgi:transcriptional regulator with XRE-family HTH domain